MLLRKGVYPYEYTDGWERFDETSLPNKKDSYSGLYMEDITDVDYRHAKRVFNRVATKNPNNKNLRHYHYYLQMYLKVSETRVLKNMNLKNMKNMNHFLSPHGLACQACLKKNRVKLELLTNFDMLLMVEKGIRGGICQATHRYVKANNNYMKNHDKSKTLSYIQYYDANKLY